LISTVCPLPTAEVVWAETSAEENTVRKMIENAMI
jgi:hypothetical protein